jgi:hypothetical protein
MNMEASQIYILISIFVLAIVAGLFFMKGKKRRTLTPLTGLAFGFIVAGIVFGDNRFAGYGLMGTGVLLAVIDAVRKLKNN